MKFGEIWAALSAINVEGKVKVMNGCRYLSWADAWGILMLKFPNATWTVEPPETLPDGSVMVNCTVTIEGNRRFMFLPVMQGFRHEAKTNPDARDISDANMRCLVKCLALFGLGHYLYAGDDLPKPVPARKADPEPIDTLEVAAVMQRLQKLPPEQFEPFLEWVGVSSVQEIPRDELPNVIRGLDAKIASLEEIA